MGRYRNISIHDWLGGVYVLCPCVGADMNKTNEPSESNVEPEEKKKREEIAYEEAIKYSKQWNDRSSFESSRQPGRY
jgi:hypothetical protein